MILKPNLGEEFEKDEWWDELDGRVIQAVRTGYFSGPGTKPHIKMLMKDGNSYAIVVREDVYFEGCMLNTIRHAQDIDHITFQRKDKHHTVEVWCKTFPLFILRARNGSSCPGSQFPFQLFRTESFDND